MPAPFYCHPNRLRVKIPPLSFQFPSFDAYICHPQFGSEMARGKIVVARDVLRFDATEPPYEFSLHDAIVEIGDDEHWISVRDKARPDFQFFVDREILDNGFFLQSNYVRKQVQQQLGKKELRRSVRLTFIGLAAVVLISWIAANFMHWGVKFAVKGISAKREMKFGDEVFKEVEKRFDVVEDTNAVAQLEALMTALSPAVHSPVPFKFAIVAMPVPNAFALPGGRICVTTELLKVMETPEQLLGVLAHESAHVKQRHIFQQIIAGKGPVYLMEILTGGSDRALNVMAFPSELLINASFSQQYEAEADACGWSYLVAAKINPHGEIEALQKLREFEGGTNFTERASAFDSHPDLNRRIDVLESRWRKLSDTNGFVILTNSIPKVAGEIRKRSKPLFGE
jgi:Zn-dependent protease with chaperone function